MRYQPRNWKVHRSGHQYVFLALGVYFPWKYSHKIDTLAFTLIKSQNEVVNKLFRVPFKGLVFLSCIFTSLALSRAYWIYKRSYNATREATNEAIITWYMMRREPHPCYEAITEIPKLKMAS